MAQRPKTKRAIQSEKTKQTIFETAIDLFSKYGFEKVKIEDITRKANVSKGTFYTHFETKESVLVAQFQKVDENYVQAMETIPAGATATDKLMVILSSMIYYCSEICGVDALKVVYINQISPNNHTAILNARDRPLYHFLDEIAGQGLETGEFQTEMNADELVDMFGRNLRVCIYDWCLSDGKQSLASLVASQFDLLLNWLHVERPQQAKRPHGQVMYLQQEENQLQQYMTEAREKNPRFDEVAPLLVSYKGVQGETVFRCAFDKMGPGSTHYRGLLGYTLEILGELAARPLLDGQATRALFIDVHHLAAELKGGPFLVKMHSTRVGDGQVFINGTCHLTDNTIMAVFSMAYEVCQK